MIEKIEYFFRFLDLQFVTNETNLFLIKKLFLLYTLLYATILDEDGDDFLSFITLNNNALPLKQSIKTYYIFNKYGIVAHYLAFATVT